MIAGRATPPSKGGDIYVINIQPIPESVEDLILLLILKYSFVGEGLCGYFFNPIPPSPQKTLHER
jgi:hypothetical protein